VGLAVREFPIALHGKRIEVHQNLYTALPHLAARDPTNSWRPIWIDAVAINQRDEEEKSEHISMMRTIYRQAQKVWVWYGVPENEENVSEAFGVIRTMELAREPIEEISRNEEPEDVRKAQRQEIIETYGLEGIERETWSTVMYVLKNPWFRRVWVTSPFPRVRHRHC
jgi:hypothetical protein